MIILASGVDIAFLNQIVIILGLSVITIYLFKRFKLPTILGFLVTGVLFGPQAMKLAESVTEIDALSEVGVVLLLFIIGLEFSIKSLVSIRKIVLLGGTLQVFLTILAVAGISIGLGLPANKAFFIGFLLALSSTAIVLKILQERGMMRSPHGRIAIGILIFQDVIVVPMMLLTPILSGQEAHIWQSLALLAAKFTFLIILIFILARYLVPKLLHEIARTRSRELFLITIIVICFAVAYMSALMGLSLALGAFMAGLCISESEYSHQATGLIIPFREIFTSFFFVSIGMLLDLSFVIHNFLPVVGLTLAACAIKWLVLVFASSVLRYPLKTGFLVGFSLFQVGEFAFILSATGLEYGLLDMVNYQYFLAVSILSMGATPFLISASEKLALGLMNTRVGALDLGKNGPKMPSAPDDELESLDSHLIIIGYGVNGKNTALTAKKADIPYVIIDTNAEAVREARLNHEPIIFGDATSHHILELTKVYKARVAVVAISEYEASLNIIANIREICTTVHIIVRCKTITQSEALLQMGASEVISEQFESSIEVFARMLSQFLVNTKEIDSYIDYVRDESYTGIYSGFHIYKRNAVELNEVVTKTFILGQKCPFSEKHLCEAVMLDDHRVRVLGIIRNSEFITHLDGDTMMYPGDEVIVFGREGDLKQFIKEWEEKTRSNEDALFPLEQNS